MKEVGTHYLDVFVETRISNEANVSVNQLICQYRFFHFNINMSWWCCRPHIELTRTGKMERSSPGVSLFTDERHFNKCVMIGRCDQPEVKPVSWRFRSYDFIGM